MHLPKEAAVSVRMCRKDSEKMSRQLENNNKGNSLSFSAVEGMESALKVIAESDD